MNGPNVPEALASPRRVDRTASRAVPWAKLRRDCQQGRGSRCRAACDCAETGRLSVIGHSADVAAVMDGLLDRPVIARRLARLLGQAELSTQDRARLVALAALHDVGKVNHAFQQAPRRRREGGGHVRPLLALALRAHLEPLATSGGLAGAAQLLLVDDEWHPFHAIMAHHGHLPAARANDARPELWEPGAGHDPAGACRDLMAAVQQWCPAAFAPGAMAWTPPFGHAFAGLLTLADWLGSDGGWFPFPGDEADVPDGSGRFAWALGRARSALAARGLVPEPARALAAALPFTLQALTGFAEPSAGQAAMLDLPPAPAGRICLIEDETGSGKTEAALIHFLDLFRRGEVDGMYLALPTRAAARSIHGRIEKMLEKLLPGAPKVVLAVPGYLPDVPAASSGSALPPDDALLPDDAAPAERDALWAAQRPKRYLAAWVAVGTIDQALMGGLRVRHAHLRSGAMLRLLLVVDEVHASDVYGTELLRNLLDQHRRAGGHALLMSATLGSLARARLLRPAGPTAPPGPGDAVAVPYPAAWSDAAPARPLLCPGAPSRDKERARKPVRVVLEEDWGDAGAVADHALAAAAAGARVLVIRNMVRGVVATQRALEQALGAAAPGTLLAIPGPAGSVCTPHHARYAPEDRALLDAALEAVLGKEAPRLRGSIACASQTAEQSLDLDADLLITDLCPADVLLQRIGRLHRHRRPRPPRFEEATCVVLAPGEAVLSASIGRTGEVGDAPLALGRVYPDLLGVLATRRALALAGDGRIAIPADNRKLVEAATHPHLLRALAEQAGGAWAERRGLELGTRGAHAQAAWRACLAWDEPIRPLPPPDERITTRLGLDDRSLDLPVGTVGPFGQAITRLTVPGRWLGGVAGDASVAVVRAGPGTLHVGLGGRGFIYDRFGLRPT